MSAIDLRIIRQGAYFLHGLPHQIGRSFKQASTAHGKQGIAGEQYFVGLDKIADGTKRVGELLNKDQYMIVDGKIIFLSTESIQSARELIYQEHFSSLKTEFALPEIVAQMEKAQTNICLLNGRFVP